MAETLISPGVLARENDQSQITSQPIQAGAAIVGPTVKGQVNIPKLITTYSEYQANFGTTFESGSVNQMDEYTFFTSISAFNYFQNGGTSLIVTRVASGTFSSATSSRIINDVESGNIPASTNLLGSYTSGGSGGTAATYSPVTPTVSPAGGTGLTLSVTTDISNGKLITTADDLLGEVQSGTAITKMSDETYTDVTLTQGTATTGKITITVTGNAVVSPVTVTTAGSGYEAGDLTIAEGALGTGMFVVGAGPVPTGTGAGYGNALSSGPITITSDMVDTVGAEGGTIDFTTDAGGAIVSCVLAIGAGKNYVDGSVITVPELTLQGSGLDGTGTGTAIVTLGAANVQDSAEVTVAILDANLLAEVSAITTIAEGTGYAVGDELTVAAADIGTPTADLVITLVDADITNSNAFVLETIGEGIIMNSTGAENAQGALTNGTSDNLRWEVVSPNTATGTFSVIIRQGNDNTRSKSVLESFNNVSLDPKSSNYISRIIGDQKQVVRGSGTDVYLQTTGSFANASRYVRVKSVNFKTPDYLDNSGVAKPQYIPSIPLASSGTFGDAVGTILTGTGKYYDKITGADTQGLVGDDYTTAINLLANKDDFKYNLISTPGLYQSDYSSTLNTLIANTENRGDNIIVLDLEAYDSSITATTTTTATCYTPTAY